MFNLHSNQTKHELMTNSAYNTLSAEQRSEFVGKVYGTLGLSLLSCAAGAYMGLNMSMAYYWPAVILEFVLLIACQILHRSFPINIILLGLFTWLMGLTLGPTLAYYINVGAGSAIPMAAGTTAVVFGGLSVYAHISKKDFSFLGGYLFVAVLGMIALSLLNMFFHLPINQTIYCGFGVLVFSGYILYDTSNLTRRYAADQVVAATIALFLDIVNLFLMLLRLFAGGRRD